MGILDNEPCRYCGQPNGWHQLDCKFGLAEVNSRMEGIRAERKRIRILVESATSDAWEDLNWLLDELKE